MLSITSDTVACYPERANKETADSPPLFPTSCLPRKQGFAGGPSSVPRLIPHGTVTVLVKGLSSACMAPFPRPHASFQVSGFRRAADMTGVWVSGATVHCWAWGHCGPLWECSRPSGLCEESLAEAESIPRVGGGFWKPLTAHRSSSVNDSPGRRQGGPEKTFSSFPPATNVLPLHRPHLSSHWVIFKFTWNWPTALSA